MRFVFLMKLLTSNNFETIVFLLSRRIELEKFQTDKMNFEISPQGMFKVKMSLVRAETCATFCI